MEMLWIAMTLLLVFISQCQKYTCIDLNDVAVAISAEGIDGQTRIITIEGNPDVWVSGGTVSTTKLRGSSTSHLFKKLAFSYMDRRIIWSNAKKGDIEYTQYVFGTSNTTYTPSTAFSYASVQIGGIAVDWTTSNIYWTDQVYNWIMMSKIGVTSIFQYVVNTGLDKPGGIRVHPGRSMLFWTDYGSSPKIERSDLLGNQRKIIVGNNIANPVTIDIDFDMGKLYWVDTSRRSIESCDFDGNNRKAFIQGSFLATFTGFSVYKNHMFGVTTGSHLYLVNISNPSTPKEAPLTEYTNAYDIEIFGEVKQPNLSSPCNSAGCAEFCVGKDTNTGYQCSCSHGKEVIFQTSCAGTSYVTHPVYVYSTNLAHCWYNVWTPDMTDSQIEHNCYGHFAVSLTHFLGFSLNKRSLYFGAADSMYYVPLQQGGNVKTLMINIGDVKAVSVDWISENVYWAESGGSINVATLTGQYRQVLLSSLTGVNGLVVDPTTGYLYWSCSTSLSYLGRATLAGESMTQFVTSGLTSPHHLTIDYHMKRLYWVDSGKDVIESIKLDGTGRKVIITIPNSVPFGIAVFQDHIVWTDRTSSSPGLHWAYKDGTGLTRSVMRANDLGTVILYGEYSQPSGYTNGCSSNNGGCSQLCLPKPSGRICKCALGLTLAADTQSCFADPTIDAQITSPLLIIDAGQAALIKMDLIKSNLFIAIPVKELINPVAIDIDMGEKLLFWTDTKLKRIYKAALDGGNQVIIKTLPSDSVPDGIAVDDNTKTVFYTDQIRNHIATIDYNGNNERVLVSQGIDEVRAIVLDKQARKMYWTDWGINPNIMSATYEGGTKVTLAQKTDMMWPNGLTLDVQAQTLYWCDGKLSRVESINTDGTGRKLLSTNLMAHYFGVALIGDYLYLTDWNSRYIQRLHKSGGIVEKVGQPLLVKAYGIVSFNATYGGITTTTTTTTTISPTQESTTTSAISSTTNTSPTQTTLTTTTVNMNGRTSESNGLDTTLVIVIAISVGGVLILVIILTIGVCYCLKKRRNDSTTNNQTMGMQDVQAGSEPYTKPNHPPPYAVSNSGFDDTSPYYSSIPDNTYVSIRASSVDPYFNGKGLGYDMDTPVYQGNVNNQNPQLQPQNFSSDYLHFASLQQPTD